MYSITALLPKCVSPIGKETNAYFFVTKCTNPNILCQRMITDDVLKERNLVGYTIKTDIFQFTCGSDQERALEMVIKHKTLGTIEGTGNSKVKYFETLSLVICY